jgi:hypothetical protein
MLLGKGGHREDGAEVNPDRGFIVFVQAEIWSVPRMKRLPRFKSATGMALNCCGPAKWPNARHRSHTAQPGLEASEGRRGIIVYQEATGDEGQGET